MITIEVKSFNPRSSSVYLVRMADDGSAASCSCPDYQRRCAKTDAEVCKHVVYVFELASQAAKSHLAKTATDALRLIARKAENADPFTEVSR